MESAKEDGMKQGVSVSFAKGLGEEPCLHCSSEQQQSQVMQGPHSGR